MFFSFRSRLFALSVLLISAFLLVTGLYLHQTLRGWTETRVEEDLYERADLFAQTLRGLPSQEAQAALVQHLDLGSPLRVTLFGPDGTLLADNSVAASELYLLGPHADRPEFQAALSEATGRARRFSDSSATDLLYVAVALNPEASVNSQVVRLALPLEDVDEILAHLRLLLIIAGFFGLGVAVFMSSIASSMMSRDLQNLLARSRESPPLRYRSLREVTRELKATMATLADERDRFRAVLEGMSEGILVLDDEERITLINSAGLQLLQLDEQASDHAVLSTLVDDEALLNVLSATRRSGHGRGEFSREPLQILAHGTRRPTSGMILVLHDVTAIRRLETIRRDFVANVSHELRTPVAVIQANAETLLDGALDHPSHARRFADGIHRNAERLTRLIADLLDISRIEAGRRTFQVSPVSLAGAVHDAISAATASESTTTVRADLVTHHLVLADPGALDQVLLNLLDNALKYSPDAGEVLIRSSAVPQNMILIEVLDQGPGVDDAHAERIFERFYRVDEGRSTSLGGTGLGLSIVKHLITSMAGSVGYRSRPEGGSIFWFTLPCATD